MKQLLQNYRTGELKLEDVPAPTLRPGGTCVKNHYSLVSAGTERAVIEFAKQNLVEKAHSRPDLVKQVLNKVKTDGLLSTYHAAMQRLDEPVPLGYSCAGEVIEVGRGLKEFSKGDVVACGGGGYASHAEVVFAPKNLTVKIPDNVSTKEAAFVTLGAIAMQGVRRAELTPGERVAVIGLGLLGQLTVQILNAYGFPVLGLDVSQKQVEKALKLGLQEEVVIGQDDDVEGAASAFSNGQGVDAVIITAATKSNEPVELAGRICRDKGRVSAVGDIGLDIPRSIYYEKELDLRISCSYGPGRYDSNYEERGIDYPIGYVRWTEKHNMEEFLRLLSIGRVDVTPMITHTFKIEDALEAYELILENPDKEDFTAVLLEYDPVKEHKPTVRLSRSEKRVAASDVVNVGLIGGGSFAKNIILPNLKKLGKAPIKVVATATGKSAKDIARKYACEYATTDYNKILCDEDIDLVIVATRHNLHAQIAIEVLKQGKNIHVEKPLALDVGELKAVIEAESSSEGRLMVGFNRRFAPQAIKAKARFSNRKTPLMIHYRVNAGYIPHAHWVHDPVEGGGRIIGEVCHFVDLLQFLTGAEPKTVYAVKVAVGANVIAEDNVSITIGFVDGSIGTILYTALGDKSLPKECIEIFGGGKAMSISNFKSEKGLSLCQDKGHYGEFEAFAEAILSGKPSPISVRELALTTLLTFKIRESLENEMPVSIDVEQLGLTT